MISMKQYILMMLVAVMMAGGQPRLFSDDLPRKDEPALLATLTSADATFFDKAKACQRLATMGTARSVPVLAGLLGQEKLAHYARFALEPIPDPAVDAAFRKALKTVKGKCLVGVINSIGARRDARALAGLASLIDLDRKDVTGAFVSCTCIAAIGRIGTSEAADILLAQLDKAKGALRDAVAAACLPCAESLLAQGGKAKAIALYDALRKGELPLHLRLAGLQGAIQARGSAGSALLMEALSDRNGKAAEIGLAQARRLPGAEVTRALVEQLPNLPINRQALLILALGDRGDKQAAPAVLLKTSDKVKAVRLAAIQALAHLGDATAVPVLAIAMIDKDAGIASAAGKTLSAIPGTKVDQLIAELLKEMPDKYLPSFINVVGKRQTATAVPFLCKAAKRDQAVIRLAAIQALGKTISLNDIDFLADLLVARLDAETLTAVETALQVAARRMPDRDACTQKLLAIMTDADEDGRKRLLTVFSKVGGTKALKAVSSATQSKSDAIRKTAIQVLGDWDSPDAVTEVLALAAQARSSQARIQLLNTFGKLTAQLGSLAEEKLAWCRKARKLVKSDAESKPLLAALGNVHLPAALTLALSYLDEPRLKEDACRAAVAISGRIVRTHAKPVAAAMQQVIQVTQTRQLSARARQLLKRARGGGR